MFSLFLWNPPMPLLSSFPPFRKNPSSPSPTHNPLSRFALFFRFRFDRKRGFLGCCAWVGGGSRNCVGGKGGWGNPRGRSLEFRQRTSLGVGLSRCSSPRWSWCIFFFAGESGWNGARNFFSCSFFFFLVFCLTFFFSPVFPPRWRSCSSVSPCRVGVAFPPCCFFSLCVLNRPWG